MGEVTASKLLRVQGRREVTRMHWLWCVGIAGDLRERVPKEIKPDAMARRVRLHEEIMFSMGTEGIFLRRWEVCRSKGGF